MEHRAIRTVIRQTPSDQKVSPAQSDERVARANQNLRRARRRAIRRPLSDERIAVDCMFEFHPKYRAHHETWTLTISNAMFLLLGFEHFCAEVCACHGK
jgi:hypothetical protein